LSPAEEQVMRDTFKAALLRAADVIDRITDRHVLDAQRQLLREGVELDKVAKVDRAMLASAHLRSCAALGMNAQATTADVRKLLDKNPEENHV
jgi:hypothetical protein